MLFLAGSYILPSGLNTTLLSSTIEAMAGQITGVYTAGFAIQVAREDEILYEGAFGSANIEQGRPLTLDDQLEWGSVSKLTVFVAIMQLAEEGIVDLRADIRGYIGRDFFRHLKYDAPITLLHIMHHTGGWEETFVNNLAYGFRRHDLKKLIQESEPWQVNRPGAITSYSNWAVTVAAYIVELATGMPFYKYARQNIFDKLGMSDTTIDPSRAETPGWLKKQVLGYYYAEPGKFVPSPMQNTSVPFYPAGSGFGTIRDMGTFARALTPSPVQCPLFKKVDTLSFLLENSDGFQPGNSHGFWESYLTDLELSNGHMGNTLSFTARLEIATDTHFSLVIMANQYGESVAIRQFFLVLFGFLQLQPEGELMNVGKFAGLYRHFRRISHGPFGLMSADKDFLELTPLNDHDFNFAGENYTQVRPNLFNSNLALGQAVLREDKLSFKCQTQELVKVSSLEKSFGTFAIGYFTWMRIFSWVLAGIAILFWVYYIIRKEVVALSTRADAVSILCTCVNILVGIITMYYHEATKDWTFTRTIADYDVFMGIEIALAVGVILCFAGIIGILLYRIVRYLTSDHPSLTTTSHIPLVDMSEANDQTNKKPAVLWTILKCLNIIISSFNGIMTLTIGFYFNVFVY